jgi:hypothetical protein
MNIEIEADDGLNVHSNEISCNSIGKVQLNV